MSKYPEFKQLQLAQIGKDILAYWQANEIFEQSISSRPADKPYTFYEGPPSANGLPGIHHVLSRSIKDIFCRYKTLKGFQVKRKGGWDTHGLPIELAVEKALGITKEDIGKKISVDDYNAACKKEVMRYTDVWNDLTQKMGYWVDLENPYITYKNEYIETLWWLLKQLHDKNLLYKGYTIQPFSPAAGTGLSSHELNQPGTYKNVKDTSAVAQFKAITTDTVLSKYGEVYFLAWTTTPWTLPSNTALAVGKNIEYQIIKTFNPYTFAPVQVIVAKDLAGKYFSDKNAAADFASYQAGDKIIPFEIIASITGKDLFDENATIVNSTISLQNMISNNFKHIIDFISIPINGYNNLLFSVNHSLHNLIGVSENMPGNNWAGEPFTVNNHLNEDTAGSIIHAVLIILSFVLVFKSKHKTKLILLFAYCFIAFSLYGLLFRYTPFDIRLLLPVLILLIIISTYIIYTSITNKYIINALMFLFLIISIFPVYFNRAKPVIGNPFYLRRVLTNSPKGDIEERTIASIPNSCLLYTSPSPRDRQKSRMPSSA